MTRPPRSGDVAGLETLVVRIGQLEEAYCQLPGWARSPQMQRRWMIACLREIEWGCECKAYNEGYSYQGDRLRFYHVLIQALMEVESGGSLPPLFVQTNDHVRVRQDDLNRNSFQARAAAILAAGKKYCRKRSKGSVGTKSRWAAKVAAAVSEAGLGGGKSRPTSSKPRAEITPSTVTKRLSRCQRGTHPGAKNFVVRKQAIESAEFLSADIPGRERLLDIEINDLGDAICLVLGPRDGRLMRTESSGYIDNFCRLAFGAALDDEALGNLGVEFP